MSFRQLLERELRRRRMRNPRYSLRAFARALGIDHSALSQILRGRRRLTVRAIRRLAPALDISPAETEMYCAAENDRALLALIGSASFRPNSRWLAAMLGIPVDDVNVSLQRLVRLRSIAMTAPHTWEVLHG